MTKIDTEIQVRKCLQLIESSLGWGPSESWGNYDFSKLSDEVHKRTQVRLSVTTLKRLWGKLKYENEPTLTTLNTLARFAGYEDWRNFCRHDTEPVPVAAPDVAQLQQSRRRLSGYWFLSVIPLAVLVVYTFTLSKGKPHKPNPDDFEFRADKVKTEGVPNSVIFNYDATAAETDSIFIVQTWDIRRKKLLSKTNHVHTAMYYYPGYFNTRLIVDGETVKRHPLWITSDGWLGLIEHEPMPLYFRKEEYVFDDRVEVTEDLIRKYNYTLHPAPPKLRFFNQRDLGDIMSDNFIFETTLKTGFQDGTGACQFVQVLIQCKDDIIGVALSAKACIGELQLYFCGTGVSAEDADLSKFGTDLTQWATLRIETVNKHVAFFVNGEQAYSLDFPNEPKGIIGVQYRFDGMGAVKDTRFEWGGKVVKL